MAYTLPEIREDKRLNFDWFPTLAQCVIYRNWGTVKAESLAKVLKTDVDTVLQMADDMGLDLYAEVSEEWLTRGYITLIRNNWHLLDYDGICTLLGWTKDHLAFILKEDDFLDIKLGRFKPNPAPVEVKPLTEAQKARTREIKEITLELRDKLPAPTAKPFDFFMEELAGQKIYECMDDQMFKHRIIYSYCALYGDTFASKELVDLSFPDDMLAQYRAVGINGVWTQAVLSKIAPYPFEPEFSEGYENRLEGIRYLCDKLEKYGIELYLYFNEPRAMPDAFFEKYPELMGHTAHPRFTGMHTMCMSTEPVRKYVYDAVAYVVKHVPKLGGLYTITASENLSHCHSHTKNEICICPRCKDIPRTEMIALVNKTICEGALSVNPNLKVFAHSWAWMQPEDVREVSKGLPKDMGICIVSEFDVHKMVHGVETKVIDYSISVEGPGKAAKEVWKYAKEHGRETYAKVQVNNTWELSTIPFIPVYDKVYRHLKGIAETGNVDHLVLSWTLGGYPSPMLEMVPAFKKDGGKIPTLKEIYETIYPGTDTEVLAKAFTTFSEAFDEFPFSVTVIYYAPLQVGPGNLLYKEKTGFTSTMVGMPYDDLTGWRDIFPEQVFFDCLKAVCDKWEEGLACLEQLDLNNNPKLRLVYDCAVGCYLHYSSVKNQVQYLMEGTGEETKQELLHREEEVAVKMLEFSGRNATFGYEATNHYYYTRQNLFEKVLNCRYLIK